MRRYCPPNILIATSLLLFPLLACCGFSGNTNGPVALPEREHGFSGLRSGPIVFVETFPIFLNNSNILVLVPNESETWQTPLPASGHAHGHVQMELDKLGLDAKIIHSTSWRQDKNRLLLTFLAVVDPPPGIPEGWESFPVVKSDLARGGAKTPPPEIPSGAVLTHALQHLSWLYYYDPAVRGTLSSAWADILTSFRPKPAMSMDDE